MTSRGVAAAVTAAQRLGGDDDIGAVPGAPEQGGAGAEHDAAGGCGPS